jgi:hypothetical protein
VPAVEPVVAAVDDEVALDPPLPIPQAARNATAPPAAATDRTVRRPSSVDMSNCKPRSKMSS